MTNIDRALIRAFQGGSSHSAVPSLLRAQPVAERVVKFPRISETPVESDSATDEESSHVPSQSQFDAVVHDKSDLHEDLIAHREIITHENLVAPARESSYGWEVDRLAWPTVVRDLLQTAADEVEQFVYFLRENPGRRHVVAVTSCRHGEGRTTMACVLAHQAAQLGIHVALVDADRANPGLASALGLLAPSGWTESPEDLARVSIHALEEQLTVVPLSHAVEDQDWQPTRLMRAARRDFELVVVDAPLVTEVEGAEWSEPQDPSLCWIVVRDPRVTSDAEVTRAQSQMRAAGLSVLGVARNFAA